jgi:putative hydrolases of HD superfamily
MPPSLTFLAGEAFAVGPVVRDFARRPACGWIGLGLLCVGRSRGGPFRTGICAATMAIRSPIGPLSALRASGSPLGTSAMCLLHDAHETRIGDVPSVGRAYVTTAAPEAISAHQTSGMPNAAANAFQELTAEFEAGQTIEAQVARDADKLETLLQAVEYQAQGHDTAAWQETSIGALRTGAAKQLAQAISATDRQWWSAFAASYRELRASAQGRAHDQASHVRSHRSPD